MRLARFRFQNNSTPVEGEIGLFRPRQRGGLPVECAIHHVTHFFEPPIGALTTLLCCARTAANRLGLGFECDLKLFFHSEATLKASVGHRLSDQKTFLKWPTLAGSRAESDSEGLIYQRKSNAWAVAAV